jgi:RNA polymerase sigma-70 factor (ECF subfamily)
MTAANAQEDGRWLELFHAADHKTMEGCYREHFSQVKRAVASVLQGADQETVIHEVFYRLLSRRELREQYRGGSVGAWLSTIAKNLAIDHYRRRRREAGLTEAEGAASAPNEAEGAANRREAAEIVDRFRREVLPEKWKAVFELRFIEQLSQRDAAQKLGIQRTTLAYQELRVRHLLRRFLLRGENA